MDPPFVLLGRIRTQLRNGNSISSRRPQAETPATHPTSASHSRASEIRVWVPCPCNVLRSFAAVTFKAEFFVRHEPDSLVLPQEKPTESQRVYCPSTGAPYTIPLPKVGPLARVIAALAVRDGRVELNLVNANGSIERRVIAAPKSGELTTAMVLDKLFREKT